MFILIQSWVFSPLRGLGGDLVFKVYLSVCFREPLWGGWVWVGGGSNPCPTYDNVNYVVLLKPVYQILQ